MLRLENQILKKQLADLRAAGTSPDKSAGASRQLAAAQAQIATLQSDKELLRMEKIVLENKMRKLSTATATATPQGSSSTIASTVLPSPGRAQDAARIKQLEGERDALQKQLTTANKELYGRKGQAAANRTLEMENQMAVLRVRLEIFEARQGGGHGVTSQHATCPFPLPPPSQRTPRISPQKLCLSAADFVVIILRQHERQSAKSRAAARSLDTN